MAGPASSLPLPPTPAYHPTNQPLPSSPPSLPSPVEQHPLGRLDPHACEELWVGQGQLDHFPQLADLVVQACLWCWVLSWRWRCQPDLVVQAWLLVLLGFVMVVAVAVVVGVSHRRLHPMLSSWEQGSAPTADGGEGDPAGVFVEHVVHVRVHLAGQLLGSVGGEVGGVGCCCCASSSPDPVTHICMYV